MKKEILKKLNKIAKAARETNMEGKGCLNISGVTISEYDALIESIIEYPRYQHWVSVTPKFIVLILID